MKNAPEGPKPSGSGRTLRGEPRSLPRKQFAFSVMRYSAALNPLSELVQTRRISHDASRHAISGLKWFHGCKGLQPSRSGATIGALILESGRRRSLGAGLIDRTFVWPENLCVECWGLYWFHGCKGLQPSRSGATIGALILESGRRRSLSAGLRDENFVTSRLGDPVLPQPVSHCPIFQLSSSTLQQSISVHRIRACRR